MKSISPSNTLRDKDRLFPTVMILPTLIVLLIMTVYPIIFTAIYSFTNYQIKGAKIVSEYVGFKNYVSLFAKTAFRQAILNTVKFTIIAVILEIVFGMLIAVFINSLKRGQKIMRTLVLIPYLLPTVTVCLIWKMMLSPNYGIINQVWQTLFGVAAPNWFNDVRTAFWAVLVIDVWQNIPFAFLLMYASLQSVPADQYEAADVDGANKVQQFFHITIPSIKSSIFLCFLMRTIDTFRLFEKVNILTKNGGPGGTVATVTEYIYLNGIQSFKFGFGSAGSIVMTILVLILSSVYIKNAIRKKKA